MLYTVPDFIVLIVELVVGVILFRQIFADMIENPYMYRYNLYYQLKIVGDYNPLVNVISNMSKISPIVFAVFLKVLVNKFFLINRRKASCKATVVFSFKFSEYFKTVGVMLLISLWLIVPNVIKEVYSEFYLYLYFYLPLHFPSYISLLVNILQIIGFVKFYFSYFMVPYILAENPNIGVSRAATISNKTMKGEKKELFCFYLSFLGWWILSNLTFGILRIFYVRPYYEASKAELYNKLRQKAKRMKICRANELP